MRCLAGCQRGWPARPLLRCPAGTPAAPVLSSPQGGVSNASVAWTAVDGATKYTLTARRAGISVSVDFTSHTNNQRHEIDLSTQADGGRGAWALEVTASNVYTASGSITHTPSTSTSAQSAAVPVGQPVPPTGVTATPGSNSVVVAFT